MPLRARGIGCRRRRIRRGALILLLDTHVWLWWLSGSGALPKRERAALDRSAARSLPALSAISLWEAQRLVGKGRITLVEPFAQWIAAIAAPDVVQLLPLDVDVVSELHALPESFRGDPVDRLIVATARVHALPLATHDKGIRRSRSVRLWQP